MSACASIWRATGPLAWLGALVVLTACGDGPVEPGTPRLEVVAAGGDVQFGEAGHELAAPLAVQVRRADSGTPQEGVAVVWSVAEGSATVLTESVAVTDSTGVAQARIRLGTSPGSVQIRAALEDQAEVSALFTAFVVVRPQLTAISVPTAGGGDTVDVVGANFSPVAEHNVVLFSGIRGEVVSASAEALTVEVPRCLPTRDVQVTAQLGSLVSGPLPLSVTSGGQAVSLNQGGWLDVDDPQGITCLRLAGGAGYLAVAQSASTVAAAQHHFVLRGLSASGAAAGMGPIGVTRGEAAPPSAELSLQELFESELRVREAELVRSWTRPGATPPARAPMRVPQVGERKTFQVLNASGEFTEVQAVARLVSDQAALYVDEAAPGGGFTASDLESLAREFDQIIHPTVTANLGEASDLDGNERVVILFTPVVNALTYPGAPGVIGGFFYGLDLLDREGSNRAEIFYALVPDPDGAYSDPRSKDFVLEVTPAILAHEFGHMVHFNERILKLGAEALEAQWLSEGLAQMAEELVARAFEAVGDTEGVERFRKGNRVRARRYLTSTSGVSLIWVSGSGSLEERGAGWLFTLYLWDHVGGDVLRRMTASTRTGVENVTAQMGRAWRELLADWLAALFVEGGGASPFGFAYPTVDLRTLLATSGGAYPLVPEMLGSADFTRAGVLWSSSGEHYIVVPPAGGSVSVRLGGAHGGGTGEGAATRLRIVRLF